MDNQAERTSESSDAARKMARLLNGFVMARAIQVAAQLGIADILAFGPKDVADVATAAGAKPEPLYRLMRALASAGLLTEREHGIFELTALGECLRKDSPNSRHPLAMLHASELLLRSFGGLLDTVKTGETAFNREFGASFFPYLEEHPEAAAVFDAAMTNGSSLEISSAVDAYDFSPYEVIVDVGGGRGSLLASVLEVNPTARGILFERAAVLEGARRDLERRQVLSRVETIAGNFFESVVPGGDIYLLKNVLHDFDDDTAVTILNNCRRAMSPASRILLVDRVIPPNDQPSPNKILDLVMLVLTGGKERTAVEYGALFQRAGLSLRRVIPTKSPMSLVEAILC